MSLIVVNNRNKFVIPILIFILSLSAFNSALAADIIKNKQSASEAPLNKAADDKLANKQRNVGDIIDTFNDVAVYYNGDIPNVSGRNTTADGYNLGLKYQCVEFIKRYYYQALHHKMPNDSGHAKDFFDSNLRDGALNKARDLYQYRNGGGSSPAVGDLLVLSGTAYNPYGHVAIVSEVKPDEIEIVQQNPGPDRSSRECFKLIKVKDGTSSHSQNINWLWTVDNPRVLGWLRKK